MLFNETDIDEIFCEQHEDVLVRKKDIPILSINYPMDEASAKLMVRQIKDFLKHLA